MTITKSGNVGIEFGTGRVYAGDLVGTMYFRAKDVCEMLDIPADTDLRVFDFNRAWNDAYTYGEILEQFAREDYDNFRPFRRACYVAQ